MAHGELVQIEHDGLGGLERPPSAAMDGILLVLLESGVVVEVLQFVRHGSVVLLYTRLDFFEERLLEGFSVRHDFFGIFVLRFKIGDDFGVLPLPQPIVIVNAYMSMHFQFQRDFFCVGRCHIREVFSIG